MFDKRNHILLEELKMLHVNVFYYDAEESSRSPQMESHVHDIYEMYVNLSGEVAFVVNDTVYPLQDGDIIISRPNEHHHGIHTASTCRRRFVLFFSGEGAEQIFEKYLGKLSSHIVIPADKRNRFVSLCHTLLEEKSPLAQWTYTLELLHLLSYGTSASAQYDYSLLTADVLTALQYIDSHFTEGITVQDMAENAHVSVSTLERHFKKLMNVSPVSFLTQKRLARACVLLSEGKSVQETCDLCGFSDYSHFIMLFKKEYGTTPLKYQKAKNRK